MRRRLVMVSVLSVVLCIGGLLPAVAADDYFRPEVRQLLVDCLAMTPAVFEMNYLLLAAPALAGAAEWSQFAACRTNRRELRLFAINAADEQASLSNEYSTWLNLWYKVTLIVVPLPGDTVVLCTLKSFVYAEFDIAYMRLMIEHLREMAAFSREVAVSAPHQLLRQRALQTAVVSSREADLLERWLWDWHGLRQ